MLSIVLLGTGNVAHHLFDAFSNKSDVQIVQVFGRNSKTLSHFNAKCQTITIPEQIMDADIYIIAVKDSSITEVSELLRKKKGLVVHTSGSVPINAIHTRNSGVFYPLQSFSKNKEVDFLSVPICIEADNEKALQILKTLAEKISNSVSEVSSAQRKKLHLAAVFANNFTNHLYHIAYTICANEKLSFELLKPLIQETADKLRFLNPNEAQTGPAKRNDFVTMQTHLEELEEPMHKKLYQLLSESIRESRL